ncbi:MAG: rRNA maturation RNase YbeY [Candidatus Omnitrophica bacterium]|nr:rRNA maturation RNase YbeY [Candidatus Omnitrophota bacterium]
MVTDRSRFSVAVSAPAAIPFSVSQIQSVTVTFLKSLGVHKAAISLVFVQGGAMRRLNKASLGHDYVTDIITFNLSEPKGDVLEGELVISPAQARRNAHDNGQSFEREICRYIAHGLLHLIGYDDATDAQRRRMSKKEDMLLSLLA